MKNSNVTIPDVIVGYVQRATDKKQPDWVRDNNKRTLEEIRLYIDRALKTA
jgi:hypothetical protein